MPQRCRNRAGFTIMELLVVVTIILAIAGMLIPSISYFRRQANETATRTLVQVVSAAIETYPKREITVPGLAFPGLSPLKVRRMWDFNLGTEASPVYDYIIDGDPEKDPGFSAEDKQAAKNASYRGLLGMTGLAVPKGNADAEGRLLDNWKHFLYIRYATDTYAAGFGVWSNGADGKEGTADDICSWK